MSTSQITSERSILQISCSHCSKSYEPFKTAHGKISNLCPKCRENQQKSDEKRKNRVRNYQAEAKRNLESAWTTFKRVSTEKRRKDLSLTKDEFFNIIQKPCFFCGYYNKDEVIGIDRIDNEKGYILENCVPACKFCNRVKHILHPIFFIGKTRIIVSHQNGILDDLSRDLFYNEWNEYIHTKPQSYEYTKRKNEEKRGIPFNISKEVYEDLIYKPCYLCGFRNRHGNGLDRIDNTKREYSKENILPCCSTCNMMKAYFIKDDFINGIKKIVEFNLDIPDSWKLIPRRGYQMGGGKSEKPKEPEKDKQWRAKTIYKAVKAGTIQNFQKKVLEQTKWSLEEFQKQTQLLFQRIKTASFEQVEKEIQKFVTTIRYIRNGRINTKEDKVVKKKRNVILPEGCAIKADDIPKHIWYVRAQGQHGERFGIDLKTEGVCWKTTSSKAVSLEQKLDQAKQKLAELYKQYPHLDPEYEFNQIKELQESFNGILHSSFT